MTHEEWVEWQGQINAEHEAAAARRAKAEAEEEAWWQELSREIQAMPEMRAVLAYLLQEGRDE